MGTAAIVQIPAAVAGGRLVDAFGGTRLFTLGGIAYLLATVVLLVPGVEADGSLAPFVLDADPPGRGHRAGPARGAVARAAPGAARPRGERPVHRGRGPEPDPGGRPGGVDRDPQRARRSGGWRPRSSACWSPGSCSASGCRVRAVAPVPSTMATASRRFGITFRREWAMPLLIVVTYVAHWGAVTAYLPIRAEEAGANIGLYFAADGIAIFAMRIPTGWLVDRVTSRTLILIGSGMTFVAIGHAAPAPHDAAADRVRACSGAPAAASC